MIAVAEGRLTAKALAALLNGREYGDEITDDEKSLAKASGLVVVYGYSDDNMEFKGSIDDEVGCYGGGTAYLTSDGLLQNECDELCPFFTRAKVAAAKIDAVWCEGGSGPAWVYLTDIQHETFEIVEDCEPFCRGIVFALADVGKQSDEVNRAAFEAFILSEPFYAVTDREEFALERDDADGGYFDSGVHGAWLAWNVRGAK